MEEKTARMALRCNGMTCQAPTIPVGHGYVVTGDGYVLCMTCAEGPSLETASDKAGALT